MLSVSWRGFCGCESTEREGSVPWWAQCLQGESCGIFLLPAGWWCPTGTRCPSLLPPYCLGLVAGRVWVQLSQQEQCHRILVLCLFYKGASEAPGGRCHAGDYPSGRQHSQEQMRGLRSPKWLHFLCTLPHQLPCSAVSWVWATGMWEVCKIKR